MAYLTEREWMLLNEILQEIYRAETFESFGNTFLVLIRKMVSYRTAAVSVVREDGTVVEEETISVGETGDDVCKYNRFYAKIDYTNAILEFPRSTSYRDIDIVDETQKRKTRIYMEYFEPRKMNYSGGLLIKTASKTVCITFFRSNINGMLTDKELFILDQLKGHLENIIDFLSGKKPDRTDPSDHVMEKLTEREKQIVPYIIAGLTNREIGEKLFIAESTVKKHVYHIMQKMNVRNRPELLRKLLSEIE